MTPCRNSHGSCSSKGPARHVGSQLPPAFRKLASMDIRMPGFHICHPAEKRARIQEVRDDEVAINYMCGPRDPVQNMPPASPPAGGEQVALMNSPGLPQRPRPSVSPNDGQKPIPHQITPTGISAITSRIQERLAKKPENRSGDEMSDAEEDEVAKKRPSALVKKRPSSKVLEKPSVPLAKTKKKNDGTSKPKHSTTKGSDREGQLHFRAGFCPPRKVGPVTIFTDMKRCKWRVKPCAGSRVTKQFSFATRDREQWDTVAKHVKTLL